MASPSFLEYSAPVPKIGPKYRNKNTIKGKFVKLWNSQAIIQSQTQSLSLSTELFIEVPWRKNEGGGGNYATNTNRLPSTPRSHSRHIRYTAEFTEENSHNLCIKLDKQTSTHYSPNFAENSLILLHSLLTLSLLLKKTPFMPSD